MKQMSVLRCFLLLLFSIFWTITFAYSFEVGGIYYNIISAAEKRVEVTNGNGRYSGNVVIPESVTYGGDTYHVTAVGCGAFYECAALAGVVIPNGVTAIDSECFCGCTGLKRVEIPNSVESIGHCAFFGCSNLSDIVFPDGFFHADYCYIECCSPFYGTAWYDKQPDGPVYAGNILLEYKP